MNLNELIVPPMTLKRHRGGGGVILNSLLLYFIGRERFYFQTQYLLALQGEC